MLLWKKCHKIIALFRNGIFDLRAKQLPVPNLSTLSKQVIKNYSFKAVLQNNCTSYVRGFVFANFGNNNDELLCPFESVKYYTQLSKYVTIFFIYCCVSWTVNFINHASYYKWTYNVPIKLTKQIMFNQIRCH